MNLPLPPLNTQLVPKIEPRLMKDTYKKVHIYLFDFDLLLGKGSFSKVYKGINLNTNEQVAVKVVEMSSITTPKLKQLLLQEIDILMKIKNENLIKCFEVLSSAKNTYIVMELCTYDFGTICDFIQKQQEIEKSVLINKQSKFINTPQNHNQQYYTQNLPTLHSPPTKSPQLNQTQSMTKSMKSISSTKSIEIEDISEDSDGRNRFGYQLSQNPKEQNFYPYIKQIFEGLEYLQHQNIVHRDLKLSNIFLTASKACKIGDFGFATIIPTNQVQIKDTCCIGSPLYMSPQSYIENVYSLKSDIWSFGILIFEMIYGNPPHWNCPTHEILKSEIRKPIDLKKFQKLCKISDELKEVLDGCLQVDIRKRFSIHELKQTCLFKRLFYQPLESKVIVSSRQKENIQESNVYVLGSTMLNNNTIKPQFKNLEYKNYSTIEKVKQGSVGLCLIDKNRFSRGEAYPLSRKPQKIQTFMSNLEDPFETLPENNSFTDRPNDVESKNSKRAVTSTKLGEHMFRQSEDLNDIKFNSIDLCENSFKDMNGLNEKKRGTSQFKQSSPYEQKQHFIYKNSEEMQKFLKEMKETRKTSELKNSENLIIKDSPITFTDLTNVLNQGKNRFEEKEEESPKFASAFNGPLFNSPKYQKGQKFLQNRKSTEMLMNYSLLENPTKKVPKPSTSYSPRNNLSLLDDSSSSIARQPNKQNIKEENLVAKNYSCGNYSSSSNKHYSMNKQPEKYEYKKKMLDKCISTPKFESYQNDPVKKPEEEEEKRTRYMTTSSFLSSTNQARSPRVKNSSASNTIKEFNIKEETENKNTVSRKNDFLTNTKSFEATNNLLYQFSTKAKEPSHIQKKTYWKGCNGKNFIGSSGDKSVDFGKNLINTQQISQNQNTLRNNTTLFTQLSQAHHQPIQQPAYQSFPSFKLLNGELIIQDACELIHFSRLLHKISFMTQNNGNSILLLQYSVQILRNLLEKCDNFEIKYHYDASTHNPGEIREAFKSNDLYLSNLLIANEKQCYAIKREILTTNSKETSSTVCNKTLQLKTIIESYIKKYLQRKEALVKLFECNILFENLTNKVKQAKLSTHQNSLTGKPNLNKRSSVNCERGFLNFNRLEKAIQQIETQFLNKKEHLGNNRNMLSTTSKPLTQSLSNKLLLKTAVFYIEAIQRCVSDHSFMRLIEFVISMMTLSRERIDWDFVKENKINELTKNKSVIERLLEGCSNEQRNNAKSPSHFDSNNEMFEKNYSVLVGHSSK